MPQRKQVALPEFKLTLVGDISFSREIANKVDTKGVDFPLKEVKDILQKADITIGNLESPFMDGKPNKSAGSMIFGAELKNIPALKQAGFDAMNLANNHFSNQGQEGMLLTFETLKSNNIGYFGAGNNFKEAHSPYIMTVNNLKLAFLGYTDLDVLPANSIATEDRAGVAVMDEVQVQIDILEAKKLADMVFVSMHSGIEYTPYANNRQIDFAHTSIDAGADLVFGHHPHVVQGTEIYKDKTIIYSLGNFVFDQPWSKETQQGLIAQISFKSKKLEKMELIPVHIYDWAQPTVITDQDEIAEINQRILESSNKLK